MEANLQGYWFKLIKLECKALKWSDGRCISSNTGKSAYLALPDMHTMLTGVSVSKSCRQNTSACGIANMYVMLLALS